MQVRGAASIIRKPLLVARACYVRINLFGTFHSRGMGTSTHLPLGQSRPL
jgi:hypothetical protein